MALCTDPGIQNEPHAVVRRSQIREYGDHSANVKKSRKLTLHHAYVLFALYAGVSLAKHPQRIAEMLLCPDKYHGLENVTSVQS